MNSILLITVAGSIFIEGVGRLSSPPEIQSDRLVLISCIGLVVNLIGLFGFSHTTSNDFDIGFDHPPRISRLFISPPHASYFMIQSGALVLVGC